MPSLHTEIFVTLIHHCPQVRAARLEYKGLFGWELAKSSEPKFFPRERPTDSPSCLR